MAFNNTRTILLHGPRGMEWYCPTPARPPHETDTRHPQEIHRDTRFGAMPFPPSQPAILGAHATPGWEKRWSWTYVEATNPSTNGLTRHFLRRNPQGELLLREHLVGHIYRVLVNAENGVLPAQPDSDFPEPVPSRPLMSVICCTKFNDKREAIDYYYVAYQLRNGAPDLPSNVAANNHALQKRDGSWCLLSKTETQVPEPWQPKPSPTTKDSSKENGVQSSTGLKTGLKDGLTEGLKDAFKGSTTVLTSALDACAKGAIKLWESWRSALTSEPEEKTQATPDPKLQDTQKTINPNSSSNEAQIEANRRGTASITQSPNYQLTQSNRPITKSPNYQIPTNPTPKPRSRWSWTAIQMNDSNKTLHCLRCSPEGRLLFKRHLLEKTFTIHAKNVDCTIPPEPSVAEIEEALSLTHVEIAPGNYAVVDLLNGCPQLPERVARKYDLHRHPDGSWFTRHKSEKQNQNQNNQTEKQNVAQNPVLKCEPKEPTVEAKAEGPVLHSKPKELPAAPKKAEVNDPAKSTKNYGNASNSSNGACTEASRSPAIQSGNSENYPLTNLSRFAGVSEACHPRGERSEPKGRRRSPERSEGSHSPNYQILVDLEKTISNHLVCTEAQRTVLALWVLHTYACSNVFLTPYLNIYSPVEESGKTTCLAILRALCAQPWWAGGTSPLAFKRKLAAEATTVLLDNWQTLFRASDKHPMTGFLLNGCDFVPDLCAHLERREKHKVEACRFSPKAFAGSESLPPALARRSIPIMLQRRKPAEKVIPLPYLMLSPKTAKLTSAMQAWAKDHQEEVTLAHAKCSTQLMLSLSPHQQESARVLLAIAAVIGGDWPVKAHDALKEIFDDYNEGQCSATQLLSDIRDAFAKHGNPKCLFTNELLPCLHDLDHRTYDEWNKEGQPMTPQALSFLLRKHFGICPRSQRRGKEKLRGYQLSDFQEAWEQYLPPSGEDLPSSAAKDTPTTQTKSTPSTTAPNAEPGAATQESRQAKTTPKPPKSRLVSMSQPKASIENSQPKSLSRLRNFAVKTLRIFTAIWP